MTRDEFMAYAKREIDAVINTHKNRLMDVVYRAWAEGKKSAEIDALTETVKEALEWMEKKEQKDDADTTDSEIHDGRGQHHSDGCYP